MYLQVWTRPEPGCKLLKLARRVNDQTLDVCWVSNQQQNRFIVFPALQRSDPRHGRGVERIGAEAVERVGAKRDHAALFDYFDQFVSIRVVFKLGASRTFESKPETYGLTTAYEDAK